MCVHIHYIGISLPTKGLLQFRYFANRTVSRQCPGRRGDRCMESFPRVGEGHRGILCCPRRWFFLRKPFIARTEFVGNLHRLTEDFIESVLCNNIFSLNWGGRYCMNLCETCNDIVIFSIPLKYAFVIFVHPNFDMFGLCWLYQRLWALIFRRFEKNCDV